MVHVESIIPNGANGIPGSAYLFQPGILNRSPVQSSQIELASDESPTQPSKIGSSILWLVLGAFFAALVFGYPLLLAVLGDSHGVRYLVRLGSSLLLLVVLALFFGVVSWLTKR